MPTIVIFMSSEEGHLLPTFKLAKSLISLGHRVCYFVDPRQERGILRQGIECVPVIDESLREIWVRLANLNEIMSEADRIAISEKGKKIVEAFNHIRPDLLIVDSYLPVVALIAIRNNFPVIFMNSSLDIDTPRTILNSNFSALDERDSVITSVLRAPELVLCPREFEFANQPRNRSVYYIEASIDLERQESAFSWIGLDREKPLIYCTLGSQAHLFAESRQFFQTVVAAVGERQNWQLLLSVGKHLSVNDFDSIPANVRVVNWAPQLEVLRRASLMITHGGLGTVKECIYFDVPMIVFPLYNDQPMNTARIVYHGLGLRGDIHRISAEQLRSLIEKIERDPSYRQRVRAMGKKFREAEELGRGTKIIEKILAAVKREENAAASTNS